MPSWHLGANPDPEAGRLHPEACGGRTRPGVAKAAEGSVKQKGPKQSPSSSQRSSPQGQSPQAGLRGPDRELLGRRYATGAALRAPEGGAGVSAPAGEVRDDLTTRAENLHQTHGPQIEAGAARTGVSADAAAAVMLTETGGLPGVSDDRLSIRFEPYAFYQQTGRWLVATHKDQDAEHSVFEQARQIDPAAAHVAVRAGLGQVSGAEAEAAGYESAEQMLAAMQGSPQAQIDGLFNVIAADADLHQALGAADWQRVAELRAGPGYGALGYDDALAAFASAYRQVSGKGYGGGDDDDDKPKRPTRRSRSKTP